MGQQVILPPALLCILVSPTSDIGLSGVFCVLQNTILFHKYLVNLENKAVMSRIT